MTWHFRNHKTFVGRKMLTARRLIFALFLFGFGHSTDYSAGIIYTENIAGCIGDMREGRKVEGGLSGLSDTIFYLFWFLCPFWVLFLLVILASL